MPGRIQIIVIAAAVLCSLSAGVTDAQDLLEPALRLDQMTGGAFKEYMRGDEEAFLDQLEDDPRVEEAYAELLLIAIDPENAREDDWSPIILLEKAPPDFLLEVVVAAMGPGGQLEGYMLHEDISTESWERDAACSGCVGRMWAKLGRVEARGSMHLYEVYLRTHTLEESAPLIDYMLRHHPIRSMEILLEAYADELDLVEEVFDAQFAIRKDWWAHQHEIRSAADREEAIGRIRELGRSKTWWVRLYVLGIMNMPRYFERDIVQQLETDPNDMVRRLAKKLSQDGPRRM